MKTYKQKLYNSKKNRYLDKLLNIACEIYNFALHYKKEQYILYKISVNKYDLQKLLSNMRNSEEYPLWKLVGSQVIQQITDRIYNAYDLAFTAMKAKKKSVKFPNFKKTFKYRSITFKQAGYKLLRGNKIIIGEKTFKFFQTREIEGKIKTLTVKRNSIGEYFIFITTDHVDINRNIFRTGKSVGFDFGLKQFLTCSDANDIDSPLFFKQDKKKIAKLSKQVSSKKKGSNNRVKARLNLARAYEDISNRRENFHWQLANYLVNEYDIIYLETLDLNSMRSRFGSKISDLGFYNFLKILEYQFDKSNKIIKKIDKWYPSSKICCCCGYINNNLKLRDREWVCPECHVKHDRDFNASVNIYVEGSRIVGTSTIKVISVNPSEN